MSTTFADLGVPSSLAASLEARDLTVPTPIQEATLPDALAGRDLCGRAPTGSGKTIAFGIPLVLGVGTARPRRPRGLVLVPTRELAAQVSTELVALAGRSGPSVEAIYGGVGFDRQIKALRRGVDIIVACPGRLADLVRQRHVELSELDFVVIDEADRMADMGFLPEVRRLLDQCPSDRQTLLFSATLDGAVDVLVSKYQRRPVRHEVHVDEDQTIVADHVFWKVERHDRVEVAADVIRRLGPTVVFCRTKRGADRLSRQLSRAGVASAAIHGDRSQNQRERALRSFHKGQVAALVATDVAARGIHVDGVAAVVHFDPPADSKDYVHRSGRTARAGKEGVVVSLVPQELRKAVGSIQRTLDLPVGLDRVDLERLGAATEWRPRPAPAGDARESDGHRQRPQRSQPPRRSRSGKGRPPTRGAKGSRRRSGART